MVLCHVPAAIPENGFSRPKIKPWLSPVRNPAGLEVIPGNRRVSPLLCPLSTCRRFFLDRIFDFPKKNTILPLGKYQYPRYAGQQFKVSSIGLVPPDEKDKTNPVLMEKTTEGVPQGVKKPVPPAKPIPGLTVLLIPLKQSLVKQKRQ
jgi:hypothetical protein